MSKAFTKDSDGDVSEDNRETQPVSAITKNYMTQHGFVTLQEELRLLLRVERPKVVEIVSWAAGNGDRSENGDYIYGKKRLREIDRRVRYLNKSLESAHIVDTKLQKNRDQIFFGATVTYLDKDKNEHTVTLVGIDEAELSHGKISWQSPIAKALIKARVGEVIEVRTPAGMDKIEVISFKYECDTVNSTGKN